MKIRNKTLVRAGVWASVAAFRLLMKTCRVEVRLAEEGTNPYAPAAEKFLYCGWHDGIVGFSFSGRPDHVAALTSRSNDGSAVAQLLTAAGVPAVRGSSGRSGAAAIRQLRDDWGDHHVGITVDGPRGPRREVKDGIVYLASRTGRRIVPLAFECSRAWRVRAKWSDLTIPKPFSRVVFSAGTPIAVPPKIRREALAEHRDHVQTAMDDLTRDTEADVLGQPRADRPPEVRRAAA